MPFKAVLFDMDGVLWLTNRHHEEAFRRVLKRPTFDYSRHAGMKTVEIICIVLQEPPEVEELDRLVAEKRAVLDQLITQYPPDCTPGTEEVLRTLKQCGVKRALVTNGSFGRMATFLAHCNLRSGFDMVMASDETVAKTSSYQATIASLHLQPHECAVVEDSIVGVKAGKAAGAYIIGVLGTTTPEKLLDAGADCIVKSVAHLLGVL